MIELNINNLTKYYGANKIFEHISLEVKTGERIGLIGTNGCGKTTLMKILMGLEDYQEGEISLRKDNRVGYLNQIPVYEEGTSVLEVLQMAFETVYHIKRQMDELEYEMASSEGEALEKLVNRYSRLLEQYEHSGGYDLEMKISKISEGLQINDSMKKMLFNQLSGGEKTRVILAKILLEAPDILLLDEPTNHLDLATIEWLEGFLKEYKGAALIISHDRFFLDSVVSKIIELEYDHAEQYSGNYSYYVVEKERRFLLNFKNFQNQQKKIDMMERQIQRYRIWGEMRDSDKMYRRAKELEKRLEKIDVLDKPIKNKRKIRLSQNKVGRSGKIVLETINVGKTYSDRELLEGVSFTLFYQDSACIIGDNGSGKTTLLKMILGEEEPQEGAIKIGSQVIIGYLPQQVEYPDEEQTVLEYFAGLHNITYGAARSQLAKVLFLNEDVNKKIKFLSGGEKSRLKLCSLTFEGVNFLILDEPTNHLDIDSREVLEETLSDFDGTILFVSHDRYFINKVADRILAIENSGIAEYNGDYAYYQEEYRKVLERRELSGKLPDRSPRKAFDGTDKQNVSDRKQGGSGLNQSGNDRRQSGSGLNQSGNDRKQGGGGLKQSSYNIKKLELLEKEIEELEDKKNELELLMNLHSSDGHRLSELFEEKAKVENELEAAYSSWEVLQF